MEYMAKGYVMSDFYWKNRVRTRKPSISYNPKVADLKPKMELESSQAKPTRNF